MPHYTSRYWMGVASAVLVALALIGQVIQAFTPVDLGIPSPVYVWITLIGLVAAGLSRVFFPPVTQPPTVHRLGAERHYQASKEAAKLNEAMTHEQRLLEPLPDDHPSRPPTEGA